MRTAGTFSFMKSAHELPDPFNDEFVCFLSSLQTPGYPEGCNQGNLKEILQQSLSLMAGVCYVSLKMLLLVTG